MTRTISFAAAAACMLYGCAGGATRTAQAPTIAPVVETAAASAGDDALLSMATSTEEVQQAAAEPAQDLSALPAPPWSDNALSSHEAPEALLRAWRQADNREWCAPLIPRSLGEGEGATARATTQYGGWGVEFDKRGARGIRDNGALCSYCGRSAFGIVGTAMSPVQIVDDMDAEDGPAPTFRDGSSASIETGDLGSAAATITVAGQGCVYQVWSFLGEEHVRQLVQELRRVQLDDNVAQLTE